MHALSFVFIWTQQILSRLLIFIRHVKSTWVPSCDPRTMQLGGRYTVKLFLRYWLSTFQPAWVQVVHCETNMRSRVEPAWKFHGNRITVFQVRYSFVLVLSYSKTETDEGRIEFGVRTFLQCAPKKRAKDGYANRYMSTRRSYLNFNLKPLG